MDLKGWPYYLMTAAAVQAGWLSDQSRKPQAHVSIYRGGTPVTIGTGAGTVGEVLDGEGIRLVPHDVVVPDPSSPVTDGMEVDLGLVERSVTSKKVKVPPPV